MSTVKDINTKLRKITTVTSNEPDSSEFCVCFIPEYMGAIRKHKAFVPELWRLGRDQTEDIRFSEKDFKLGVAERILKTIPTSTNSTFVETLDVDGLFLLAVLHSSKNEKGTNGEERAMAGSSTKPLTMDGITRDVFKIPNQIPTRDLQRLIEVNNVNNNFPITDLDSVMLKFCKAHSPLVVSANIRKFPKHHLLDHLYHLIVPQPKLKSELKPMPSPTPSINLSLNPNPNPNPLRELRLDMTSEPELRHESGPKLNCFLVFGTLGVTYLSLLLWIIPWTLVYISVLIMLPFLLLIRSVLAKVVPFAVGIIHQPEIIPTLPHFLSSVLDLFLYNTFSTKFPFRSPLGYLPESYSQKIVDAVETTRRLLMPRNATNSSESTVPTVTQLHKAEIRFKPVEGSIDSIEFNEIKRELCLPLMKLDATSEVILRNLEVYEQIIESDDLKFSNYMEFMNDLIQSPEDVKILVDEEIIRTTLSDEEVANIFKSPVGKLTRSPTTEIEKLEKDLAVVKSKFDAIQNVNSIFTAFLRVCVVCVIVVFFYPLLAKAFKEIGCSTIFTITSESCKSYHVGDSAATNDSYTSSM